jgi:hypothetical protein
MSLFYAFAVRHNVAPAVLPLALWAGYLSCRLFGPEAPPRLTLSLLVGLAIVIGLAGLVLGTNRALTRGRTTGADQHMLLHDLAGISLRTGVMFLPSATVERGGPPTVSKLRCIYSPDTPNALLNRDGACELTLRLVGGGATNLSELRQAWLRAVSSHPGAHVEHRLAVFAAQFAIGRDRVCLPFYDGIDPNSLGLEFAPSGLNSRAMQVLGIANDRTPLFRGWVYVALTTGLLLLTLKLRPGDRLPGLVLGSSGLLYALSYLGVAVSCQFRMHWWTVVAAVVLVPLTLAKLPTLVGSDNQPRVNAETSTT